MTDRELLEAAAKAAGIKWVECGDGYWLHPNGETRAWWNPLEDDGDEARLEAALGIDVTWLLDQVCVHDSWERFADHGGDKQAARRRAGVRAAASLGERGKG